MSFLPLRSTLPVLAGLLTAGLLACTLLVLSPPAPSGAHPFGPPLQARLEAQGSRVVVSWTGAEDDWVILGDHVGAFRPDTSGQTGEEVLARSPEVGAYLTQRITVEHPGGFCAREQLPVQDLLEEGYRFAFDCPATATGLTVGIAALTDVDESYRTVLSSDDAAPGQVLFTAAEPSHRLTLGESSGPAWALPAALATAVVLLAGGVLLLLLRRRTRG